MAVIKAGFLPGLNSLPFNLWVFLPPTVRAWLRVRVSACACAYACACACARMHACTCMCVRVCMRVCWDCVVSACVGVKTSTFGLRQRALPGVRGRPSCRTNPSPRARARRALAAPAVWLPVAECGNEGLRACASARTFAHRTLTSKHTRTQTYRQTHTHTHTHTHQRARSHTPGRGCRQDDSGAGCPVRGGPGSAPVPLPLRRSARTRPRARQ